MLIHLSTLKLVNYLHSDIYGPWAFCWLNMLSSHLKLWSGSMCSCTLWIAAVGNTDTPCIVVAGWRRPTNGSIELCGNIVHCIFFSHSQASELSMGLSRSSESGEWAENSGKRVKQGRIRVGGIWRQERVSPCAVSFYPMPSPPVVADMSTLSPQICTSYRFGTAGTNPRRPIFITTVLNRLSAVVFK